MTEGLNMSDIEIKLDRLCNGMDVVKEKQEEMAEDIAKIKEAVYNPDQGLYARLRALEAWQATSSKMIWTLFTTVVGLVGAFILKSLG
jgi:peptidoglycan hydrolase CwlO-like protein|tara:strand:+ start:483 stop:746 length:264 start_codon:yes stop_codon:yes gene_type:complete